MKQKPMSAVEMIEEYEWLIDGGMHPINACAVLDRKPATMARLLYRYGKDRLAKPLDMEGKGYVTDGK